jgi:protoporphyrinogen oxidase
MWERAAALVVEKGGEVRLGVHVDEIVSEGGRVTEVRATSPSGAESFRGTHFLSTMPIRELIEGFRPEPPAEVLRAARALKYRDFLTVALIVDLADVFPDNWIYVHDPSVRLGRIQNFKNWSREMVPDASLTCLGLEYFCNEGDDLWSMSDAELVELGRAELSWIPGTWSTARSSGCGRPTPCTTTCTRRTCPWSGISCRGTRRTCSSSAATGCTSTTTRTTR